MSRQQAPYSLFTRITWLAFAMCVLLLCGPIKKVIELKHAGITQAQQAKQLKNGFREKKETPGFLTSIDTGNDATAALVPALLTFISLLLITTSGAPVYLLTPCAHQGNTPLYLRLRRIQV